MYFLGTLTLLLCLFVCLLREYQSMKIDHDHHHPHNYHHDHDHREKKIIEITCIFPTTPVESIRDATFTAFPQMSYWGFFAPANMLKHWLQDQNISFNIRILVAAFLGVSRPAWDLIWDYMHGI